MAKQYTALGSVVIGATQYKKGQIVIESPLNEKAIAKLLALKTPILKEKLINVPRQKSSEKQ